jgi:hypothetical protein
MHGKAALDEINAEQFGNCLKNMKWHCVAAGPTGQSPGSPAPLHECRAVHRLCMPCYVTALHEPFPRSLGYKNLHPPPFSFNFSPPPGSRAALLHFNNTGELCSSAPFLPFSLPSVELDLTMSLPVQVAATLRTESFPRRRLYRHWKRRHRQLLSVSACASTIAKWGHRGPLSLAVLLPHRLAAGNTGVAGPPRQPPPWLVELPAPGQAARESGLGHRARLRPGRPHGHCWASLQAEIGPYSFIFYSFLNSLKYQKLAPASQIYRN